MRFGDGPESEHFEDRTGGGGGLNLGGGLGMILPLVASRFGITGILILALGYCVLTQMGGGGILGGGGGGGKSTLPAEQERFLKQVLGNTEQVWGQIFTQAGAQYQPTTLVAYTNYDQSGCGAAQAAMGPFYCPSDRKIYIDPVFFEELSRRFGAPGDFAQAYVIAHEVGHHIQTINGTSDRIRRAQSAVREGEANAMQVQMELQADCLAGVWASRERGAMEAGDLEEGMRAAAAIGDDTLQRAERGTVVPESFTHGTSQQRQEALMRGYNSGGNPAACQGYTQRF